MPTVELDHVNIRTPDPARLATFYRDAIGLEPVEGPAALRPTVWLGQGGRAFIHLVEAAAMPFGAPQIEHFAFRATGLAEIVNRLRRLGTPHQLSRDDGTLRLNLRDPDGNRVHLDFDAAEDAA